MQVTVNNRSRNDVLFVRLFPDYHTNTICTSLTKAAYILIQYFFLVLCWPAQKEKTMSS